MKRILLSILLTGAMIFAISCASQPQTAAADELARSVLLATNVEPAPAAQPATQPAVPELPKGHPDISAMMKQNQLPAGHPEVPGMSGMPQLPAGHPDISTMVPSTQPNWAKLGTLTIRAIQGTIGGPAIAAGDAVTVEVIDRDRVINKIETKLGPDGTATVGSLPLGPTIQPLVTVTHAGVSYQAAGNPIDGSPQSVTVKVYEPTEQPVGWEIRMRHIMLQPTNEGVQVVDMLSIDNATDRAYIGTAAADGSRKTFELPIPAGAKDVQMQGGFHDCCTKIEDGKLINTMAIVPGTTQYQLSYTVPLVNGKAEIQTGAPVMTKHLIVFAPDDGTSISAEGLESGTTDMGRGTIRFFKANALPKDQAVKLIVTGTPTRAPGRADATGAAVTPAGSASLAKTVAGIGGLVIFLIGGAMLVRKAPSLKAS